MAATIWVIFADTTKTQVSGVVGTAPWPNGTTYPDGWIVGSLKASDSRYAAYYARISSVAGAGAILGLPVPE